MDFGRDVIPMEPYGRYAGSSSRRRLDTYSRLTSAATLTTSSMNGCRRWWLIGLQTRVILRLIGKWLNAGFMVGGVVTRTEEGSPQGGPISPILSNIYLHFVLDLWFEKKIRPACQGEAYLTRFADDFVVNFQYRRDAEEFQKNLTDRFGKFGLELAEEKTRVMRFGRFVRADLAKTGEKPDTFDFLGFKHVCGTDRGGKFALVRVPCVKSRRKFLAKSKEWLSQHRHWKRRDQQKQLVTDAARLLPVFRIASLQAETRRGPARGTTAMDSYVETTQSAAPALLVLSQESILVRTTLCGVDPSCDGLTANLRVQPGEPVAGNLHGGFCEGGRAQAA